MMRQQMKTESVLKVFSDECCTGSYSASSDSRLQRVSETMSARLDCDAI